MLMICLALICALWDMKENMHVAPGEGHRGLCKGYCVQSREAHCLSGPATHGLEDLGQVTSS